jgi:hypothetical protein
MSMEERIRHLLLAAGRAEAEGDLRTARIFRRMASEALPAGVVGDGSVRPGGA